MKVLSIKYRFCASIDPVTYDSFDIKGARSLETMVQTHLTSESPYLKRDDVLPTMSTGEGTFYVAHDDGLDDESDADPPRKASLDGVEVALFSELELVPTIPEDVEGDDALEFPDVPYRRRDRISSSLDLGESEVGKEFSNKDSFLGAVKQHSTMNGVKYNMVKSKSDMFEAKCTVQDDTCVSEDHPKIDSDMLATLILPKMKADPRASVPILIANICSQLRYTPYYRKAWIAKQKALEKIHGRFKRHVCPQPSICVISDRGTGILAAIERQGSLWHCTHHRYCLRPHEGIIGRQYRVHLRNITCDCGRFVALRYPCAYVIAACQNLHLDPMSYVDEVYKLETMYNVWRHVFPPVPNERKWPPVSLALFKLLPDRELHRKPKGRPCSTRIRDLVVDAERVTHLDRIMIVAVFASPMAEVFESRKVMGIGRKKSSPMELSFGQKVGCLQLFDITHRKKDGSPMTTEVTEIMEKLKDKRAEYEAMALSDNSFNLDDIDNQVITEVLGIVSSQQYMPSANQTQAEVQKLRDCTT
ncbi:hypothetical protein GOBAR_AA04244 [Gossypium barbadense]|uniref:SWIM-type domain-containing protein n=1 Tax=Gossypium barbadense TaxID=3634 RepID=A0A2P5YL57_GOSBA|nr:hypothetical protein GOBAR_AA04244 [Gossypium barbadense]